MTYVACSISKLTILIIFSIDEIVVAGRDGDGAEEDGNLGRVDHC